MTPDSFRMRLPLRADGLQVRETGDNGTGLQIATTLLASHARFFALAPELFEACAGVADAFDLDDLSIFTSDQQRALKRVLTTLAKVQP